MVSSCSDVGEPPRDHEKEPAAKQVFERGILRLVDKRARNTARDAEHD